MFNKLKGRIKEKCGTQGVFCKQIGMTKNKFTNTIYGRRPWTTAEISKSCQVLDIPLEEVHKYFF